MIIERIPINIVFFAAVGTFFGMLSIILIVDFPKISILSLISGIMLLILAIIGLFKEIFREDE